jgi:hypothetical protein
VCDANDAGLKTEDGERERYDGQTTKNPGEKEIWDEKESGIRVPDISQDSIIVGGYETAHNTGQGRDRSEVHKGEFGQPP